MLFDWARAAPLVLTPPAISISRAEPPGLMLSAMADSVMTTPLTSDGPSTERFDTAAYDQLADGLADLNADRAVGVGDNAIELREIDRPGIDIEAARALTEGLARLVRKVCTVEIVPPLAEAAAKVLQDLGYDNVSVKAGDGYHGWPECGPFDAVIVTAALEHVPPPLIEQLKVGGRLVMPVITGPRIECGQHRGSPPRRRRKEAIE